MEEPCIINRITLHGTTKGPVAEMILGQIFEDPLRLYIDSTS